MNQLRIEVRGMPAPQGSKKFVGMHGGRGVMVESSKKVKPWRDDVRSAVLAAIAQSKTMVEPGSSKPVHCVVSGDWFFPIPLDNPLRVRMIFTLPKPSTAPKKKRTWPMRTPDLSKLVRSTEDAITSAGLWADDARVVECIAAKRYPGEGDDALNSPGCVIYVEVIHENYGWRVAA